MQEPPSFGSLLRRYRAKARLTQEELAERAQLSVRGLIHLEHGTRRPYRDTLRRLVAALQLTPAQRDELTAAAYPDAEARETRASGPDLFSLPSPTTSFIGRARELAAIRQLLASHCLVSLTGPGGTGKTRLAVEIAHGSSGAFRDGVWFMELAPVVALASVPDAVARTLRVHVVSGVSATDALVAHFSPRHLLLILDNCEHLVEACATLVAALLARCPGLTILTTSRESLRVAGEQIYHVPVLSLPDHPHSSLTIVQQSEAAQLFLARTAAVRPGLALTASNAAIVANICRRLDGIPLALELAAARMRALSFAQLDTRLDDRFRLLIGGDRAVLPRHQTLRAMIDWSYDRLAEDEKLLLERLSVFVGAATLGAVEAVCAWGEINTDDILDLLTALLDKSLVAMQEAEDEVRYTLLQTIRRYAAEKLATRGEAVIAARRYADYYVSRAEASESAITGPDAATQAARLEREDDNVGTVLGWLRRQGATVSDMRVANTLAPSWLMHLAEGNRWLTDLSRLVEATDVPAAIRADALCIAGSWLGWIGEADRALPQLEESMALFRSIGNKEGMMHASFGIANARCQSGDSAGSIAPFEEALALARESGDQRYVSFLCSYLSLSVCQLGDQERAQVLLDEGGQLLRDLGDTGGLESITHTFAVAMLALSCGDRVASTAAFRAAIAASEQAQVTAVISCSYWGLGLLAYLSEEYGEATRLLREGVRRGRDYPLALAANLWTLVLAQIAQGERVTAAQLAGAFEQLRRYARGTLTPPISYLYTQQLAELTEAMGEESFVAARAAGRAMSQQEVIRVAFGKSEVRPAAHAMNGYEKATGDELPGRPPP